MSKLRVNELDSRTGSKIEVATGTDFKYKDGVVQIKRTVINTTSTITTATLSSIGSVSITPKFSNCLIKVDCVIQVHHANYYGGALQVFRNVSGTGTALGISTDTTMSDTSITTTVLNYTGGVYGIGVRLGEYSSYTETNFGKNWCPTPISFTFYDEPNTTSAISYDLYGATSNSSYPLYINRPTDTNAGPRAISVMTVTEIGQ